MPVEAHFLAQGSSTSPFSALLPTGTLNSHSTNNDPSRSGHAYNLEEKREPHCACANQHRDMRHDETHPDCSAELSLCDDWLSLQTKSKKTQIQSNNNSDNNNNDNEHLARLI